MPDEPVICLGDAERGDAGARASARGRVADRGVGRAGHRACAPSESSTWQVARSLPRAATCGAARSKNLANAGCVGDQALEVSAGSISSIAGFGRSRAEVTARPSRISPRSPKELRGPRSETSLAVARRCISTSPSCDQEEPVQRARRGHRSAPPVGRSLRLEAAGDSAPARRAAGCRRDAPGQETGSGSAVSGIGAAVLSRDEVPPGRPDRTCRGGAPPPGGRRPSCGLSGRCAAPRRAARGCFPPGPGSPAAAPWSCSTPHRPPRSSPPRRSRRTRST